MTEKRTKPLPEDEKVFNDTLKRLLDTPPKHHKESKRKKDKR